MFIPETIRKFGELMFIRHQALTYVVGGAVRDQFTGRTVKDYDLEVVGLPVQDLEAIKWAHVQPAGDRFGVWIVTFEGETFEVALPQVRHSSPDGDRSKEVAEIDPWLPIAQSLARRDFTCNAMAYGILTDELIDPFGGVQDIEDGMLRCVNPVNFAHDPLRVLRGMVRCAKDNFTPDARTISAASQFSHFFGKLSSDRVREEWVKWSHGDYPHKGIEYLRWTGWIKHFPVLDEMANIPQDPVHHPEGDVLNHTILALETLRSSDPVVVWATLLHDVGKAWVIEPDLSTPGHAQVGADLVVEFFHSAGFEFEKNIPTWVKAVQALVAEHMWMMSFTSDPSHKAIRRLARRLSPATIRQWGAVCLADINGRDIWDVQADSENIVSVVERASSLDVSDHEPVKIVTGKALIEHDIIEPGVAMGKLLDMLLELQLDGWFDDLEMGLKFARELVADVDIERGFVGE